MDRTQVLDLLYNFVHKSWTFCLVHKSWTVCILLRSLLFYLFFRWTFFLSAVVSAYVEIVWAKAYFDGFALYDSTTGRQPLDDLFPQPSLKSTGELDKIIHSPNDERLSSCVDVVLLQYRMIGLSSPWRNMFFVASCDWDPL